MTVEISGPLEELLVKDVCEMRQKLRSPRRFYLNPSLLTRNYDAGVSTRRLGTNRVFRISYHRLDDVLYPGAPRLLGTHIHQSTTNSENLALRKYRCVLLCTGGQYGWMTFGPGD